MTASTLRWFARVVAVVVVFAPLLAMHHGQDLRLMMLAALSVAFVAALSHGLSVAFSLVLSVVGFAVLENVVGVPERSLAMSVLRPVLHAALLAPLTLAMHRYAAHDSDDALDRVMLATEAVRVEPLEQWKDATPVRSWLRLSNVTNDAVVVGRMASTAGAYRAGDVEHVITAVPIETEGVVHALGHRIVGAGVLLAALGVLATTLSTLRW